VYDFSEGAGTLVIPTGATGVTIEVWGAGGGGGFGTETFFGGEFGIDTQSNPGGGGGGGGYAKTILVLAGGDALKTILWAVGAAGAGGVQGNPVGYTGGASSAYGGSYSLAEMVCLGGGGGLGGLGVGNGDQGAGGLASGGNTTNTPGNGGGGYLQSGAAGIAGVGSLTAGAGGDGGDSIIGGDPGRSGQNGRVRFKFTF
jgi:hypothetical protein